LKEKDLIARTCGVRRIKKKIAVIQDKFLKKDSLKINSKLTDPIGNQMNDNAPDIFRHFNCNSSTALDADFFKKITERFDEDQ
jgi:hypothetical protein